MLSAADYLTYVPSGALRVCKRPKSAASLSAAADVGCATRPSSPARRSTLDRAGLSPRMPCGRAAMAAVGAPPLTLRTRDTKHTEYAFSGDASTGKEQGEQNNWMLARPANDDLLKPAPVLTLS